MSRDLEKFKEQYFGGLYDKQKFNNQDMARKTIDGKTYVLYFVLDFDENKIVYRIAENDRIYYLGDDAEESLRIFKGICV